MDKILARLDSRPSSEGAPPQSRRQDEIRQFLLSLDVPDEDARAYLVTHLERITRTLSLVPEPGITGRVLELGAYMQMTPALGCLLGYREVRGAYYGNPGTADTKVAKIHGQEIFRCEIDLFDAEKDAFPYPSEHFDAVLACEILEHLLHDPMHMLFEIRRVLATKGALIVTTPNIASSTSVARLLHGRQNPQICARYAHPERDVNRLEIPHVREYTPQELQEILLAAGFEITCMFTEDTSHNSQSIWIREFLARHGYPQDMRGEQIYCIASKGAGEATTRYPDFLYEQ